MIRFASLTFDDFAYRISYQDLGGKTPKSLLHRLFCALSRQRSQMILKTDTICQWDIPLDGTQNAFFDKVGSFLSAARIAEKISPVPERDVPIL